MQSESESGPGLNNGAPRASRPSTNSDASLLTNSLKRLSLHAAANTPPPPSPGPNSPRLPSHSQRLPSSPGFAPNSLRRSPSAASLSRSSSPALGRKGSSSSLRADMPPTPRAPVSRRSSLNPMMPSPSAPRSPGYHIPRVEEKAPLQADDVAEEYFKKELAVHEGIAGAASAGTLVLVHDQCYGHRFSRPKTSKAALNTVFERPERIIATVMGIATAYVRLGQRHDEGAHSPHPDRNPPERIPFKIRKTSRLVDLTSPVVTNVHGTKWMEELRYMSIDAGRKLATTGKELVREPNPPTQPPKKKFHETDLYLCSESLNAFQGALGGVLDAVDAVFQGTSMGTGPSRAFVCIRPPGHHCSDDHPSGFCWINNVHVGIEHAIMQHGLTHAAIIDFDLHHGDGSQSIAWARNKKVQNLSKNVSNKKKTSIGYFSLHDINSFPCEDGDDDKVQAASLCIENAHGQTVWNTHLQPWKTLPEFWSLYEEKYLVLLDKTRKYLRHHTSRLRNSPNHPPPKAAIFLSAGFDASEWEIEGMQRHGVSVPTEFYARFTRDVVRLAEEEGTGAEGRVISVLEGGYSDRALTSGVLSHICGLTHGQIESEPSTSERLHFDMQERLAALALQTQQQGMCEEATVQIDSVAYDPRWWDVSNILQWENHLNPPATEGVPKKPKGPPPTYSSPTQSFTAKVVDPTKLHRTVSGKYMSASPSRAPTPPPPEVDWATASHALRKLLVPSDRQVLSCKAEELAEPKIKKEKPAPVLSSVHVDPSGRQLRGRKSVKPYAEQSYAEQQVEDMMPVIRAASRANRRRTIADLPLASEEPPVPARSASRRMSIASSIGSVNGDMNPSRASSVAPGRRSVTPAPGPTAKGVAVKKTRGPANTTSSTLQKAPPVPRLPSYLAEWKEESAKKKENDVDELAGGMLRLKLKLPPKEEYEAREQQKAVERLQEKKKAVEAKRTAEKAGAATTATANITSRKLPTSRAKGAKTATTTTATKKGPGRPTKAAKPPSPVGRAPAKAPGPERASVLAPPEPPKIEQTATVPLEQTTPIPFEQTTTVPLEQTTPIPFEQTATVPLVQPQPVPPEQAAGPSLNSNFDRRSSAVLAQPPTELKEMTILPEHLPKPEFMKVVDPLPLTISQPRADTPPPPPPSGMGPFVNYTAQSFGPASKANITQELPKQEQQTQLQWMPSSTDGRPMSPGSKRQDLPVFTASGMIPFAPNPSARTLGNGSSEVNTVKVEDVWEVPETPAR